eukprot:TRINITY_DN12729_c0_g1_i8.p1 TRINITY_DN12729_c0_g1~~TRINITY_DN12729_c0_g1_i8.p1  ORF type:complete len:264 (+),score=70.85 TRINITY_DN12729_c0_g1_i8:52-843(+)
MSPNSVTIGGKIGKGGFASIFNGSIQIALKRIEKDESDNFLHEISVLSKLQSPFLIHSFGIFSKGEFFYIAMEYIESNLQQFIEKNKNTLDALKDVCLQIGIDVAHGLKYLHFNNIIHADLKSLNILITNENRAKICDFGASKLKSLSSMTCAGPQSAGTKGYKPLELGRKGARTTKMSDIFSFGVVLWELQSFKIPFDDCHDDYQVAMEMNERYSQNEPVLPIPTGTNPLIQQLIKDCWKMKPEDRPTIQHLCNILLTIQKK